MVRVRRSIRQSKRSGEEGEHGGREQEDHGGVSREERSGKSQCELRKGLPVSEAMLL